MGLRSRSHWLSRWTKTRTSAAPNTTSPSQPCQHLALSLWTTTAPWSQPSNMGTTLHPSECVGVCECVSGWCEGRVCVCVCACGWCEGRECMCVRSVWVGCVRGGGPILQEVSHITPYFHLWYFRNLPPHFNRCCINNCTLGSLNADTLLFHKGQVSLVPVPRVLHYSLDNVNKMSMTCLSPKISTTAVVGSTTRHYISSNSQPLAFLTSSMTRENSGNDLRSPQQHK